MTEEKKYKDKWCQEAYDRGFKEGREFEKEQLTEAKNLLQKVADVCGYPNYDIPVELYSEIADFLKK